MPGKKLFSSPASSETPYAIDRPADCAHQHVRRAFYVPSARAHHHYSAFCNYASMHQSEGGVCQSASFELPICKLQTFTADGAQPNFFLENESVRSRPDRYVRLHQVFHPLYTRCKHLLPSFIDIDLIFRTHAVGAFLPG